LKRRAARRWRRSRCRNRPELEVARRRGRRDAAEQFDVQALADEVEVLAAEHREVGGRVERLEGARQRDRGDVPGEERRARVEIEAAVHRSARPLEDAAGQLDVEAAWGGHQVEHVSGRMLLSVPLVVSLS
jgi:hypothetical protein